MPQDSTLHEPIASRLTRVERSHREQYPAAVWHCALELDEKRERSGGSEAELMQAICRGADLRVGTGFRHHEHIEVGSNCRDLIHEFIDFRITYLLENRWTAGVCNLRMPVHPPDGFGPRESMSFFMYNQNGQQAVARPHLDDVSWRGGAEDSNGQGSIESMDRYHELDRWDERTNAPSTNFVYDFDFYRYCVADRWREILAHDAEGNVQSGSLDELLAAFSTGAEFKVAIRGLCEDLAQNGRPAVDHEVFVHLGSCYYYTDRKLFLGAAQPVVRIAPTIPLVYRSHEWDFGWLLPRTDGHLARWLCDPYTLKFHKSFSRHAMRWFVGS